MELIRDTDTLDTDPELSDHQINSELGNNEEMFTRNTDTNTDTQHYCSLILVFFVWFKHSVGRVSLGVRVDDVRKHIGLRGEVGNGAGNGPILHMPHVAHCPHIVLI